MKRILIYILCALLLVSGCAAEEYTCGDYIYALNADGTATVTCFNGVWTDVSVPEELDGHTVTAIGEDAFYESGIENLVLPDGIVSIGRNAFAECSSLSTVSLPASLTELSSFAFYWCSSLIAITLPEGVTEIGECTFYHCTSLASVSLPDTLETIGDYAFSACQSLSAITIPDSVTVFGGYVFSGCTGLTARMSRGSAAARYCANHGINCVFTD